MNPIRRFRETRGITQRELAEVCFVDVSAVRHWEHNRRDPSASVIIRIATEFGVPTICSDSRKRRKRHEIHLHHFCGHLHHFGGK